jgi:hypothetical protein
VFTMSMPSQFTAIPRCRKASLSGYAEPKQ